MSDTRQPPVPTPTRTPSQEEFDWAEFQRLRENE
jgi:hypothetical protein